MKRHLHMATALFLALFVGAACGDGGTDTGDPGPDPDTDPDGDGIAEYRVTGNVVDFETGELIAGAATVSTTNLDPAPSISTNGSSFTIDGVPPHSVFNLLVGSPPDYQSTYGAAVEVLEDHVDGVEARAISNAYLGRLAAEFGVMPSITYGTLIVRAVGDDGQPQAGVGAEAFELDGETPPLGPFFLDADLQPDIDLMESSSSGYVVFFQVQPGLVAVTAADASGYGMEMGKSPTSGGAVTLAEVLVTDGPVPLPTNVSFTRDVVPIFLARGCDSCHSGGGIGKDLGNLALDAAENKIYKEVAEEISPLHNTSRVNVPNPELSLLLTMPSAEDPPDGHPNVTFAGPSDPDYRTILAWITEGALQN